MGESLWENRRDCARPGDPIVNRRLRPGVRSGFKSHTAKQRTRADKQAVEGGAQMSTALFLCFFFSEFVINKQGDQAARSDEMCFFTRNSAWKKFGNRHFDSVLIAAFCPFGAYTLFQCTNLQ